MQTAYLLAEVVIMPLTAYLSRLWGTQRFYVIACVGFIVTSVRHGPVDQHRHDDPDPRPAGLRRRRDDPDGVRHRLDRLPARAARLTANVLDRA